MNPPPQIDMAKVLRFVRSVEARPKKRPATAGDWRSYPPIPSPVAHDVALRKPLHAHGVKCPGFNCGAFLNRE